jgi:predicted HD phosphohydrolase
MTAGTSPAPSDASVGRDPLLYPDWQYVENTVTASFTAADWAQLDKQRDVYYAEVQAAAVLRMMAAAQHEPTFGYQINHYHHGLQVATMLLRDGYSDEDVVVGLLHDIGFIACPERHGAYAGELLGAYVSDRNYWMVRHHQEIGDIQTDHGQGTSTAEADWQRWRGHPHFAWTLEFVQRYDLNAIDPSYDSAPLEFFEPLVRRVFVRPGRPLSLD